MTTGARPAADAPQLLRAATRLPADLVLDPPARRVLEHDAGFLRVLGGPGTGKTTLLAERVAQLLHADPDARSLVLVGDRRSAAALRERISARRRVLDGAADGALTAAREPLVRSVHSYAFAVLRRHAARREEAPPRLLPGAQQDAMVRELLAGEADGAGRGSGWPARLQPALEAPAFAAEVRDLLLRAAERGLGPRELRALGKEHDVAVWVAAARFYQTFEEVTLLRAAAGSANPLASAPPLDAAELVAAVLDAFATDPGLLASEQEQVRHLVVDDAQDMDPQQLELARTLGATARAWVLAGDPDSSVLGFRGAAPDVLREADPGGRSTAVLTLDHRGSPAVRDAVARAVEPLRGTGPGRRRVGPPDESPEGGAATVSVFPTPGRQAAWAADTLRRAHLVDGVPWSRLAVVVRSVSLSLPPLRRALLAAGVPLAVPADDTPLAALPAVAPVLTLLRCAATAATAPPSSAVDADTALGLLSSPLGGAEPLGLRRLRRGLLRLHEAAGHGTERSSDELIVDVLVDHLAGRPDPLAVLPDADAGPLRRVAHLLGSAVEAIRAGESVPDVVWAVWSESGLQSRWVSASERGGITGAQADRDLDAVVALVERAGRFVEDLPGGTVAGFVAQVDDQRFASDGLAPRTPDGEAVALLTAHAARGREWDVVVIPDVQEGVWPDLRRRGTLLGVERMVDVLAGVPDDPALSSRVPLLDEERRLFAVALSRARRAVHVGAVESEDVTPSRFLDDVEPDAAGRDGQPDDAGRRRRRPSRSLVLAELVGDLRRAVTAPSTTPERRARAATQLARLAEAGVPGADPGDWYGLLDVSTAEPLREPGSRITVSPSAVETILTCPLRWALQSHGGDDSDSLASVTGSLVHALVQRAAEGAGEKELDEALDVAWASVDAGAPWFSRRELANCRRMLRSFLAWRDGTRRELTEQAVEETVTARLEGADADVAIRGRVDRLEVDDQGRPVIVDVKTGKSPISAAKAAEHPQLAVYQLAVSLGAFAEALAAPPASEGSAAATVPGGARLVYLQRDGEKAKERAQQPLDEDGVEHWREQVATAARMTEGPVFVGQENDACPRCPVRTACPVHSSGRQVP
ncbi:ATP-dependent helicase [Actinomycetospora endophytica]|uniref:DNA 3'-5' helicase n=1 Tax=Actinomycetospora endophytica TaxID=2291215 RepID=A0ABS8P826_9PSEU|nr:ATP-dependent DNA helicase [Actinomycetospora endophytica]MCD2194408.1 ATP-dependent helicase [Actinomycetospora endophytica]